MSDNTCSNCGTQSPENALYCQGCGRPIRCQKCRTTLLSTAQACIQCGSLIPEMSSNNQFHLGTVTISPGYNRLRLHETPDVRDVDLLLSDNAIEQIRDVLPPFMNTHLGTHKKSVVEQQNEKADIVEVAPESTPSQPQLLAASTQIDTSTSSDKQRIWEIFSQQEGKISQEIPSLKATAKKDYTVRLLHLYLYAKLQLNEDKVPRIEIYKFLEDAGVRDSNLSTYISRENGIRSEENNLILNQAGRNKAQQYISDVFDNDLPDGWYPGTSRRSTNGRIKKPSRRGNENQHKSKNEISALLTHEETKALASTFTYSSLAALSLQNKILFGLYALHKVGVSTEVMPLPITQYLYGAFQIQVLDDSFRKAIIPSIKNNPPYATYLKGRGYRITSAGIEHMEELLKQH